MKATEFCYWLQGYFELCAAAGGVPVGRVNARGVAYIRAHLRIVQECDPKHENVFVEWLDQHLQQKPELDMEAVAKVRRLLGAQFRHVVDPSYGGDQKKLGEIHGTGPDGIVNRC